MNAKHVFTAANVVTAIYRIAYTGTLLFALFKGRRSNTSRRDRCD